MELSEFIALHKDEDTAWLVLHRDRWPDVDVALAAESIAARRKLRTKVPEWYANPALVFPSALSAEQCSSTATAAFKAEIAATAAAGGPIADLTGGLGVDTWQFSLTSSSTIYYNEASPALAEAAARNFSILGRHDIRTSAVSVGAENIRDLLRQMAPGLVYMDPARRDVAGRKVFRLEDCSPDVLTLKDAVLERCPMLLKLSPMADITLICRQLGNVKQIWAVQSAGECRELLVLMEPGFEGECRISAADALTGAEFSFMPSEEKSAPQAMVPDSCHLNGAYFFEPGSALMKTAPWRLLCTRFGLQALGKDVHCYIGKEPCAELAAMGKWFTIRDVAGFGKKGMALFAKKYPQAAVTARALPQETDAIRSRMALGDSGEGHIFALGTALGRLLLYCEPLSQSMLSGPSLNSRSMMESPSVKP